jgi:hypothetical protein
LKIKKLATTYKEGIGVTSISRLSKNFSSFSKDTHKINLEEFLWTFEGIKLEWGGGYL